MDLISMPKLTHSPPPPPPPVWHGPILMEKCQGGPLFAANPLLFIPPVVYDATATAKNKKKKGK